MTVKGGKKCHICLERKLGIVNCDYCGHNTCADEYCLTLVFGVWPRKRMCLKCKMDLEHRILKEVPVA